MKSFQYRGPAEKLAARFETLARHRQHVRRELGLIQKLMLEHPELSYGRAGWGSPRLHLVVDNTRHREA